MKLIYNFLALIFWMLITLLLAICVLGLFVIDEDWMLIGKKLTEELK